VSQVTHSNEPKQRGRVFPRDPLQGIEEIAASQRSDELPAQGSLFGTVGESPLEPADQHDAPPPSVAMPPGTVQRFCDDLDEASGPKPVSVVEELFRNRYTPLVDALNRGLDDTVARAVVDDWRSAFEKSYADSFTAMKVTGKRPSMVLDVPELATRIARVNGARVVQLLLVDSMRYDLGQRVLDRLKSQLGERAACVEQNLMWSALPTVTPVQLHLLARGPRGLQDLEARSERDPTIHRDGSVTAMRRVRIGHRDLVKLDLVEARLRDSGGPYDERMDSIALEVAEVIARFTESLAPRTLLYVFGDHGFRLAVPQAGTTGPAEQGGSTPEEVLVGGQAWLVGDLH